MNEKGDFVKNKNKLNVAFKLHTLNVSPAASSEFYTIHGCRPEIKTCFSNQIQLIAKVKNSLDMGDLINSYLKTPLEGYTIFHYWIQAHDLYLKRASAVAFMDLYLNMNIPASKIHPAIKQILCIDIVLAQSRQKLKNFSGSATRNLWGIFSKMGDTLDKNGHVICYMLGDKNNTVGTAAISFYAEKDGETINAHKFKVALDKLSFN